MMNGEGLSCGVGEIVVNDEVRYRREHAINQLLILEPRQDTYYTRREKYRTRVSRSSHVEERSTISIKTGFVNGKTVVTLVLCCNECSFVNSKSD